MRIGIEIGGTFTDLILMDEAGDIIDTRKVLSTPNDPAAAVMAALDTIIALAGASPTLLHGSTVATNAVLERKGARTGLLTTEGFADILDLQRQDRERIYQLQYRKPEPLIPRELVRGIPGRVSAEGETLQPLDDYRAIDATEELVGHGVTSLAICFLHSYAHANHEQAVADAILDRYPDVYVSKSSDVVAEFREYERASTTVIDAFIKPVVRRYLERLEDDAAQRGVGAVLMMQSNGGLLPARYVREHPARTLFSGPAAGVTGAIRAASASGIANIVTMDMGGTSTDVCLVSNGQPGMTTDATIDRLPLHIPMIDIVTVGAGGGSISWIDSGGLLQVGPQSAGANPGPACYGFGGQRATTTDANVVRGFIRPGHFLGGGLHLDSELAVTALSNLASELGRSPNDVAESVTRLADVAVANALRLVSTERGYDPRDYTLVAYGGAGPLHAAHVADELAIDRVLIPPYPGLISAFGLLAGQIRRDFARTSIAPLETGFDDISRTFEDLRQRAHREIAEFDIDPMTCAESLALDMRYRGQGFELTLPLDDATMLDSPTRLATAFHNLHRQRYGHATPNEPVELVTFRLSLFQPFETPQDLMTRSEEPTPAEKSEIFINGSVETCRFYWRPGLSPTSPIAGPAVIEEPTATTFVPPGWVARVAGGSNLILERTGVS